MKTIGLRQNRPVTGILLILFFALVQTGYAAEEWGKFLDRLIEKEYFDTAEEYLELMRTSPLAPPELQEQIDYQLGRVTLLSVNSSKDALGQLVKSRERFAGFLAERPEHSEVPKARETLAKLLTKEAEYAQTQPNPDIERVRSNYTQARDLYAKLAEQNKAKSEQLAAEIKAETNQKIKDAKAAEQTTVNYQYVDYRMQTIELEASLAKTFPQESGEFQTKLRQAAEEFHKFDAAYRNFPAISFLARYREAKVRFDLGEIEKSKSLLQELSGIGIEFPALRTQVLSLMLEINDKEKNYRDSFHRINMWVQDTLPAEKTTSEGQKILLRGTHAAVEMMREPDRNAEQITAIRKTAQGFLATLLDPKLNSFLRVEAEQLKAALDGKTPPPAALENSSNPQRPASFKDFEEGVRWVQFVMEKYADKTDELHQGEFSAAEKEKIRQQLNTVRKQTIRDIETVLAMRNPQKAGEQQDEMVLLLYNAGLLYAEEDYYEKAYIFFDVLCRKFPESDHAASAAVNALKSLRILVMNERSVLRDAEDLLERMRKLSLYAVQNWKDDLPMTDMTLLLLDAYLDTGKLKEAVEVIHQLPEDSEAKWKSEIRAAITLWGTYTGKLRLQETAPSQEELDPLRETVKSLLDDAVPRCAAFYKDSPEPPDKTVLYAVRYYAQIFLREENNPEAAISWLENETIGPLTFLDEDATYENFPTNEFRIGVLMELLQAQVRIHHLDEAEKTMNRLDALAAEEGTETASRLVAIYYQLGKELEEQLEQLTRAGKNDAAQSVTEGFSLFLTRIADRKEGNTYYTLSWAADTFYRLGKGLSRSLGAKQQQAAKEYLSKAGGTYLTIRKRLLAEPEWGPKDAYRLATLRMSECLRSRNHPDDCKAALTEIAKLLKENENFIDLQMEAARIYQAWAADPKFRQYYIKSIVGGLEKPDGKNLVWGWNGIIRVLAASDQFDRFQDLFYEANYNKCQARLLLANTKTGKEQEELLKGAEAELLRLYQLRPDLGGPEWFAKFDAYLRNVHKLLGNETPKGLR
ncbi:MAG: hypothetical protein LBQ54_09870 [Planctomycetaceae bacterium]|nr:hypothetical protein [Planctomycetaceae bacterium]